MNFHLKRVIRTQLLTYEEFQTLISRDEGALNPQPYAIASMDPHDIEALTPGYFLIRQPILSIPEVDVTSLPMNRLTPWLLLRQLYQSFRKRRTREYLTIFQGHRSGQDRNTI